jgi:hypothetical protein
VRVIARCLIVAVTSCSWLSLSNHCAFSALAAKTQTTQSGCPFHSKPAKPQSQPTECCKILRAVRTTPVKSFAPAIVDLSWPKFVILAPPKIFVAPITLDTGPPGKTSFIELNASVRANAPPFFV